MSRLIGEDEGQLEAPVHLTGDLDHCSVSLLRERWALGTVFARQRVAVRRVHRQKIGLHAPVQDGPEPLQIASNRIGPSFLTIRCGDLSSSLIDATGPSIFRELIPVGPIERDCLSIRPEVTAEEFGHPPVEPLPPLAHLRSWSISHS